MLDKAFQRTFFTQLGALTDEQLKAKMVAVSTAALTFEKGSEAAADARFMMRHMRREQGERLFNGKPVVRH